jgi:hypothetical protein
MNLHLVELPLGRHVKCWRECRLRVGQSDAAVPAPLVQRVLAQRPGRDSWRSQPHLMLAHSAERSKLRVVTPRSQWQRYHAQGVPGWPAMTGPLAALWRGRKTQVQGGFQRGGCACLACNHVPQTCLQPGRGGAAVCQGSSSVEHSGEPQPCTAAWCSSAHLAGSCCSEEPGPCLRITHPAGLGSAKAEAILPPGRGA